MTRRKYNPWTPEEDNLVRQHYPNGGVTATKPFLNRTHGAIAYRAHVLQVTTKRRNAWTRHEDQLVEEHYPKGGAKAVQGAGVNRSAASIISRANRNGLTITAPCNVWTPKEDELLKRHYPTGGTSAVMNAGVDRTHPAIQARAYALGIKYISKRRRTPPKPKPKSKGRRAERARLADHQAEHLRRLAALNGDLLDSDNDDANRTTLRALTRMGLAKHIGAGLYAITLAGLIEHRNQTA